MKPDAVNKEQQLYPSKKNKPGACIFFLLKQEVRNARVKSSRPALSQSKASQGRAELNAKCQTVKRGLFDA